MSDVIAVHDKEVTATISRLKSNYESVSKALTDFSDTASELSSIVTGDLKAPIVQKCTSFVDEFDKVKNNLQSIIDDFENVKSAFNNEQSAISTNDVDNDKGGDLVHVKK